MARSSARLTSNVDGMFFVDSSCIDCAVCRNVAPRSFARSERDEASVVMRQPSTEAELLRAKMALVACPTSSIGSQTKLPLADAIASFPEPLSEDIYFCGFASEESYGAQSYLVRRPDGNVLIDSPRAVPALLDRIAELGGVRWMFLTHRDDVADHAKLAKRFGCTRVLHRADVTGDTRDVERVLDGDEPIQLEADLLVIPVPGHTAGSCALLYRNHALFTGDHLFANDAGDELYADRGVCWHSWERQKRSLVRLLEFEFDWVLPGHEGRMRTDSSTAMRERIRAAITRAG